MKAEIISIGDELLIGQVVNTNAAWMAGQLNLIGIKVVQVSVVPDALNSMKDAFGLSRKRVEVVLVTGGLGPTRDDLTKQAWCEYFQTGLRFDEASFSDIRKIFESRNLPVSEVNRMQAELPGNCIPLRNPRGTAPGMWMEDAKGVFVSMPGVPYEMKGMMTEQVLPRLKNKFRLPYILHHTILTQGIGESFLQEMIQDWELALPPHMKLAYLPSPGMVRLRLSAEGSDREKLEKEVAEKSDLLKKRIPEYIYGYGSDTLEEIVGRLLAQRQATLATAESCTGGYVAHRITSVEGSSAWFKGAVVAYDNSIKTGMLQVGPELIPKYGAVSEEVAKAMADGVMKNLAAGYSIATTGIAGPTGGTEEKPVGTVWIAVGSPAGITAQKFIFGHNRERNIHVTALNALNMLRKELLRCS